MTPSYVLGIELSPAKVVHLSLIWIWFVEELGDTLTVVPPALVLLSGVNEDLAFCRLSTLAPFLKEDLVTSPGWPETPVYMYIFLIALKFGASCLCQVMVLQAYTGETPSIVLQIFVIQVSFPNELSNSYVCSQHKFKYPRTCVLIFCVLFSWGLTM